MKSLNYLFALLLGCFTMMGQAQTTQDFSFSATEITTTTQSGMDVVHLKNASLLSGEEYVGDPQLPVVSVKLALPQGQKASSITVTANEQTTLPGTYNLAPVPKPEFMNGIKKGAHVSCKNYYTNAYPTDPVVNYENFQYREYNYVIINFIPFAYHQSSGQLNLYTNVTVSVTTVAGETMPIGSLRAKDHTDRQAFAQMQRTVDNPQKLLQYYTAIAPMSTENPDNPADSIFDGQFTPSHLPSKWGSKVPYVIIANNHTTDGESVGDLVGKFQEFADWKTRKGTPAKVVSVDTIKKAYKGADTPEKIRNFIKDAHRKWGTEYVLLGGAGSIVPVRWMYWDQEYPNTVVTDLYYASLDGNWNANGNAVFGEYSTSNPDHPFFDADIGVGRAPVHNVADVENFIKKNLTYAQTVLAPQPIPNGEWMGRTLLGMGEAFSSGLGLDVGYDIIHDNYGKTYFYGMFEYDEDRVYNNEGILFGCNDYQGSRKSYYPLHNTECTITGDTIDRADLAHDVFLDRIEQGYGLINVFDHGLPRALCLGLETDLPALRWSDFEDLADTGKYGVFFATGCYSAPIDRDTYIGERWVNSAGGGVAYFGHSENIWGSTGAANTKRFFERIFEDGIYNAADLMRLAAPDDETKRISQLLGDPDLSIYTDAPSPMNVNHNYQNGITLGHHDDFTVTVSNIEPGQEALVSLYKPGEVSAYAYGDESADITFDITPDTEGKLYITVTSHNRKPYEDSIMVTQPANKVHLYQNQFSFNDENDNEIVEPGENIMLTIQLHNTGGMDATNISAVLSSPEAQVLITQANSAYGDIPSGAAQSSTDDFVLTAPVSDTLRAIPLQLLITTDQGVFNEAFLLDTKSANLKTVNRQVSTANQDDVNSFSANDEVEILFTIKNAGQMAADSVYGKLTALDPGLATITKDSVQFGNIAAQDEVDNEGNPYKLTIAPTYNGYGPLLFVLELRDKFGLSTKDTLDLTEDRPVQVFDSEFEYTATDHSIKPAWDPVSNYEDIQGYNLYWSLQENGNYQRVNDELIRGASTYDHTGLDADTDYWYKIGVVSASGYERPLGSLNSHKARTKIPFHNGFPASITPSGIKGAHSAPTVYDSDGDGKKEIFVAYRNHYSSGSIFGRIAAFDSQGNVLYHINGNRPDENWGFAGTGKELYAKPAVGDLEGDGKAEVFAVGRGFYVGDGQGSLYGFRTTDLNGNGKPDPLWNTNGEKEIGHKIYRAPVLADLNNDGYLEIMVLDEHQTLRVFSHDGQELGNYQVGSVDFSESQIAVADVDNDGYPEVFYGVRADDNGKGAIFKWDPDGDLSVGNNGVFVVAPEIFHEFQANEYPGGPVLADIDNNGSYELLTITKIGVIGYVYALEIVGGNPLSCAGCQWNGDFTISLMDPEPSSIPRIAVGDLTGDGFLEVVFGSSKHHSSKLYALNYKGMLLDNFPKTGLSSLVGQSPILANIRGNEVDIIINNTYNDGSGHVHGGIIAFAPDGSRIPNLDLKLNKAQDKFVSSPYVGDIDNDGKNEIVASTYGGEIYVWDTQGDADKVEWGGYRHDAQNTGAYGKAPCVFNPNSGVDLVIRDGQEDVGDEPYTGSNSPWESPDIWIRNQDDGKLNHTHENPEYNPNTPNFVYVKLMNRGCSPTSGQGVLKLYWANASTALYWPDYWDGQITVPSHPNIPMGGVIGVKTLPVLQPGQEAIVKLPWQVPNPSDYESINNGQPHHFCLLARVVSPEDPMSFQEAYPITPNVINNNNIAWKNVTVVDYEANQEKPIGGAVLVANPYHHSKGFDLNFETNLDENIELYKQAEITVELSPEIFENWQEGGGKLQGLKRASNPRTFILVQNQAKLSNLVFNPRELAAIFVRFHFLTQKVINDKHQFEFSVQQYDSGNHQLIGGETYLVKKQVRPLFYAGVSQENYTDSIVLKADTLSEPAIYNWYDEEGNLIHTGSRLGITAAATQPYKLEVIAQLDGYKDYKKIEFNALFGLENLFPNPAESTVEVQYHINHQATGILMITNAVNGVYNNYMLDAQQNSINIDVSNYPTGVYVVSLVSNGTVIDYSKLIVK